METGWVPNHRGTQNKRNRAIVRRLPSIISDRAPCDPHHWPLSRAHLGTDGLLEMVPLTREEHELATQEDPWTCQFIEANALEYFKRIYLRYGGGDHYMGPGERVAEVRLQVEADVAKRRKALGLT